MAQYEVEYAKFIKVRFEADSLEEAKDMVCMMDDEVIEQAGRNDDGYVIWNEPMEVK